MTTIFTITTLKPPYHTRTVAWYRTLETAQQCITENWCDIHEGDYVYSIIEEIEEGVYPVPAINEYWYRWTGEKYTKIEKPKNQKNVCGFGIG